MIRINNISAPLDYSDTLLKRLAAKKLEIPESCIKALTIVKKSVDARKRDNIRFIFSVDAETENEKEILKKHEKDGIALLSVPYLYNIKKAKTEKPIVVVGFGPAGMFAALTMAQGGARVIVVERGECVEERMKSVDIFRRGGRLNTESNVQFGEGGAGTFSDGKLTTGTKDMRIRHVFRELVRHGAPAEILTDAMPHIGTDRLTEVVRNTRNEIISLGGEILFSTRFCGFEAHGGRLSAVCCERDGKKLHIDTDTLILATGHSARDTVRLLLRKSVAMKSKSFAMGMRVEHLQADVNRSLYGDFAAHPALSPAPYKLFTHLADGRGVYSFCMCPGGTVIAAASEEKTVVTNGMSVYARDGKNANSALLVGVNPADFDADDVTGGIELQRKIEHAAFIAGGGDYRAPASLVGDFLKNRVSAALGRITPTYLPGINFAKPDEYLPDFICNALREGIRQFGRKYDFFRNGEAVLTGAETRSSSPVTIIRGDNLQSESVRGIYPCGEGAGYAGGIVSAAVDGIRCAEAIIEAMR